MKSITRDDAQWRGMMSNGDLAVLVLGQAIEDCNDAACRLLGRARDEIVGRSPLDLSAAEQADGTPSELGGRARIDGALAGQPQWFTWRFRVAGGVECSTLVHLETVRLGGRRRLVAHIQDLSSLLRAEISLRDSEYRLRQILDQSDAVVFWKDLEGRYLFVNREFCRLVERDAEAVLGRTDAEVMPPEVASRLRGNDAQVLASRRAVAFEENGVFRGEARTYLVSKFPLLDAGGAPYAVCGIATDITERKRIEDALQAASLAVSGAHGHSIFQELVRYLATIIGADWVFIALRDAETARRMRVLALWSDGRISRNFDYDLAGTPCERVVGQEFRVYRERLSEHFPADADFARLGMQSYAGYPLKDARGRALGLIAAVSRRPLADPVFVESVMKIFAVRAVAELERERMDRELRASEESYRAIFEASEDCIFIHDIDTGAFVDVNPKACEVYGFDYDAMLTLHPGDLGSGAEGFTEGDAHRWLERARAGEVVRFEWQRRNADGSLHWDEVCLKRIRLAGVDRILAVTSDVTVRKRAEEERARHEAQLRQSQKMEAIGHLAGGIAHDFNNILASITGYLALAGERQAELGDARLERYLDQAGVAARRARDLVRQLLTFSRGQRGTPRPLSLRMLVEDLAQFLGPMLPSTVLFEVEVGAPSACAMADPVQLEQVLMNLCINARDAIGGHGCIRIAVERPEPAEAVCASCRATVRTGQHYALVVADEGPGIPPEVLERMFEPFFTTKEVGKGSGMGLATVHGIVHDHGGHVLIDTGPDRGTTFRVLLPALPETEARCGGDRSMPRPAGRERLTGRVLLVDDEELVTGFLRELLEGWGVDVAVAGDGLAARETFATDPQGFDAVLSDQTMPRMTGLELAREIRRLAPDTPVLLFSGYAEGLSDEVLEAAGVVSLLHKPVEPATLYERLQAVLQGCC